MSKYVVPMLESERGWGQKIDGYAGPFETYEESVAWMQAFNNKWNNEDTVPDWYIAAQQPIKYTNQKCNYTSENVND